MGDVIRMRMNTASGRRVSIRHEREGKDKTPRREREVYKIRKKGKQTVSLGLSSALDLHVAKTRQTCSNRPPE